MGRQARHRRALVSEETKQNKNDKIILPQELTNALVEFALSTNEGRLLIIGFRLGHPDIHPSKGKAIITVEHATIQLDQSSENGS